MEFSYLLITLIGYIVAAHDSLSDLTNELSRYQQEVDEMDNEIKFGRHTTQREHYRIEDGLNIVQDKHDELVSILRSVQEKLSTCNKQETVTETLKEITSDQEVNKRDFDIIGKISIMDQRAIDKTIIIIETTQTLTQDIISHLRKEIDDLKAKNPDIKVSSSSIANLKINWNALNSAKASRKNIIKVLDNIKSGQKKYLRILELVRLNQQKNEEELNIISNTLQSAPQA
jgi:hypothetical protein